MSARYSLITTILLALNIAHGSGHVLPSPAVKSSLQKRATVDCGTWVMECGGTNGGQNRNIKNACNNACFYVNHVRNRDYTATFRTDVDNSKNRKHSGCNVGSNGHSICTWSPVSQKLTDGKDFSIPSCDEFPMADWKQDDWKQSPIRNTLRCMDSGENAAAGAQWKSFKEGTGTHPERKCTGNMDDPDTDYTFKISWNMDHADKNLLPYCQPTIPPNHADTSEFWMTEFRGPNGANHFPQQPLNDNIYALITNTQRAYLEQCRVEITRKTGDLYTASYFNGQGIELGKGTSALTTDGAKLVLTNDKKYTSLVIVRTGEMGNDGTKGSRIDFESVADKSGFGDKLRDLKFSTESTGVDERFADATKKGGYCKVDDVLGGESTSSQKIVCYFTCTTLG